MPLFAAGLLRIALWPSCQPLASLKRSMRFSRAANNSLDTATSAPALLGLVVLGREMISTVFEQGKFDATAGDLTYDVLTAYALALPAYVATEVVTRGLISLRDTKTPLVTNSLQPTSPPTITTDRSIGSNR